MEQKIKDIAVITVPTGKIYLFGSYAYGTPSLDSDYRGKEKPLRAKKIHSHS